MVVRRVHPTRVGWEKDLYSIPGTAAHLAQSLEERFFRQLDDVAARALRKMNPRPIVPLTAVETSAWSVFMLSLLHRTPECLQATKDAARRMWTEVLENVRDQYSDLRSDTDPASFEEYVSSREPAAAEQSLLWGLPELIANPRIGQFVNDMHWAARDIPFNQPELLLSDNALARTNGIRVPGGHLAMPLSPRRLLLIAWERDFAERLKRSLSGSLSAA